MRRLLDTYYVSHLTYGEPLTDGYWDIPLSPNAKYFLVFEQFDLCILDDCRLPMDFKRLNLFHNKYGNKIKEIWSNDVPDTVKTYKPLYFKGVTYYLALTKNTTTLNLISST